MKMNALLAVTALGTVLMSAPLLAEQAPAASMSMPAASTPISDSREAILSTLPADKQKIYKDGIQALRAKNTALHDQIIKLQQDISTVMTADKFDKAAFIAKNEEIEKLFAQMRSNTAEAIASIASQFSLEERKILEKAHQAGGYKRQQGTKK